MNKFLKSFNMDYSDLPAAGGVRAFTITGDIGAEFMIEITNEDNSYYNFNENTFQAKKTSLDVILTNENYSNSVIFPVVTDNDQYDIKFWAKVGTSHAEPIEVRFADDSLDINSSTGSNSLLIKKVIYQYLDVTLTLSTYSPNSIANIIQDSSKVEHVITIPRFSSSALQAFTLSCEISGAAQSYQIIKQPTADDILTFNQLTVGSTADLLPGEDEYPAISNTDTVNGAITGGGSDIKVVMDTRVAEKMLVGDKITASVSTDTVDGAISSSSTVIMDNNAADKAAVGDRIFFTGYDSFYPIINDPTEAKYFIKNVVVVSTIAPLGNAKAIKMSLNEPGTVAASATIADGSSLTFVPKCNSSLTTVVALNPDGNNESEFSMSQNIGFIDGVTLSFSNRKNYQWPVNNIQDVGQGMQVFPSGNILADTLVDNYEDTITLNEGTENEQVIIENSAPFKTTKNQKPTVTNGIVTTQAGNIVFNKQQPFSLAGDVIYVGDYGTQSIFKIKGYDLSFSDLKIELDAVTTTTTSAVTNSTTIPVASVNGILPGVSTVSGIGIDPSTADPTVVSRSVTSGAGELTLSAAQNLESGVILTFANAGQKATITGNIEILQSSHKTSPVIRFDVEKLLSIT